MVVKAKVPTTSMPKKHSCANKIIKDWFTGIDGETFDPARFLWFLGVFLFLVLSGYEVYRSGKFDMANFSLGYAGLLAAGAAGVKIKETSEPKPPVPTTDKDA